MAIQRNFQGLALGNVPYSSPLKQGTGVNPIHAIRDGSGRNVAPDGSNVLTDPAIVGGDYDWGYGYQPEDFGYAGAHSMAESPSELGIDVRPKLRSATEGNDTRAATQEQYPSWGYTKTGVAKGNHIRSILRGAVASNSPNVIPDEDVAQGWRNKDQGQVIEPGSGISDPSQYTMQTSMQQLRRTRAGSQISGTASKQDAPIASRVPGQFVRVFVGPDSRRHSEMYPRQAHPIIRPFWNRTFGAGQADWMEDNEPRKPAPLSRVAPGDPYQGDTTQGSGGTGTGAPYASSSFGYTGEDAIY